jgi:siroheme synthase-like protein
MLYPLFVNLQGKRCVVIGAGLLAERRIENLYRQGAVIRVVAPQATATLKQMAAQGSIGWMRSLYSPVHLENAFLVIAATDLREVNEAVTRDANERNMLVCCADDPGLGNYLTGASIDRGGLQIAITTSGGSPTLAAVVKSRLTAQFGPEWSNWVQLFAMVRPDIQSIPGEGKRREVVEQILETESILALLKDGNIEAAEEAAKQCILSRLA